MMIPQQQPSEGSHWKRILFILILIVISLWLITVFVVPHLGPSCPTVSNNLPGHDFCH